jgi:hypothetical protein
VNVHIHSPFPPPPSLPPCLPAFLPPPSSPPSLTKDIRTTLTCNTYWLCAGQLKVPTGAVINVLVDEHGSIVAQHRDGVPGVDQAF